MKRRGYFHKRTEYIDDDSSSLIKLLRLRIPPLIMGLFLGLILTFVTSNFEKVLSESIEVAFFIPLLVYLSDAVGTQTQSIYIRDLKTGKANFKNYMIKEAFIGVGLAIIFAFFSGIVIMIWFKSIELTIAVCLSMIISVAIAPTIALLITQIFKLEHEDPALGSGPIATVIQDAVTILIYGFIASWIML